MVAPLYRKNHASHLQRDKCHPVLLAHTIIVGYTPRQLYKIAIIQHHYLWDLGNDTNRAKKAILIFL